MLVVMLAATGVVLVALIVGIVFAGVGSALRRPIVDVSAARRRRLARIWSGKAWHPAGVAPTKTARSSGLT